MTIPFTIPELDRWRQIFACRTPDRIRVEKVVGCFQCRGCSGSCGTSHFDLDPKIIQSELLLPKMEGELRP